MQKDAKQAETLSPAAQEAMRDLVTAIRVVKIYPPNNPIYSQSIKKASAALTRFLEDAPAYTIGVQKTLFTFEKTPVTGDAQMNRSIAQDLFLKGIREMVFSKDVTESEILTLCKALALSSEEMAIRSGISSFLWEKGASHIKVTEAGLEEVITAETSGGGKGAPGEGDTLALGEERAKKQLAFTGRTLVLTDVMTNPEGFGASMIELARQTKAEHETVEDRLHSLYQEAGNKVLQEHGDRQEAMFEGLAKSVIALESPHRENLVAGKLYGDLDTEIAGGASTDEIKQAPSPLQEIRTGRFTNTWNVQQVVTLLKRSVTKMAPPPAAPPSAAELVSQPLLPDLDAIAQDLTEYRPEELEELKSFGAVGMESDIIEAAARTLINLIPLTKDPLRAETSGKTLQLFSGVVHQLEDLLTYLLKKNNYEMATTIIKALHAPVPPEFQPRMLEAQKKTATKTSMQTTINDMRKHNRDSPEYQAAYSYLTTLDRKATEALLDLLAEEKDRNVRLFLLDLVKDIGKNQIALLGEYIADGRWYVVRNIVSILAETKADQVLAYLRKAAENENVQVRQEVIKGVMTMSGKRATSLLAHFLRDPDTNVRITAINALGEREGMLPEDAKPLIELLQELLLNKKDQEMVLEAIKAVGMIGGASAAEFLKGYTRVKWWKPRKLQEERRDAAKRAMHDIARRTGDGGRAAKR